MFNIPGFISSVGHNSLCQGCPLTDHLEETELNGMVLKFDKYIANPLDDLSS